MTAVLSATVALGFALASPLCASSIAYNMVKHGRTVAHVVTVNLADPKVRVSVALARGGAGASESFRSVVARTRPAAAITGTFYDTRSYLPTGDIALFGTLVHSGSIGSALCIDSANRASIVELADGRKNGWKDYETVLCAGPTLVRQGKVAIALRHEGFRSSLLAPTRRTAVGITRAGKLVLVAINRRATLYDMAKLMLHLNVTDALCLDGGSSTAFYCHGAFKAMPSRAMTNCLVVYSTVEAYKDAKPALAPARSFARSEPQHTPAVAALRP